MAPGGAGPAVGCFGTALQILAHDLHLAVEPTQSPSPADRPFSLARPTALGSAPRMGESPGGARAGDGAPSMRQGAGGNPPWPRPVRTQRPRLVATTRVPPVNPWGGFARRLREVNAAHLGHQRRGSASPQAQTIVMSGMPTPVMVSAVIEQGREPSQIECHQLFRWAG